MDYYNKSFPTFLMLAQSLVCVVVKVVPTV